MTLPRFEYQAPRTGEEVVALLREHGEEALLMGGGLTVLLLLRERLMRPSLLIGLSEIPELAQVIINGHIQIGAMVTHARIERSADLRKLVPLLCEACGRVGSPAIRNMGTLGGNVSQADGASDPSPALLALDAEAIVMGPEGKRVVALKDFFRGLMTTAMAPDEVLTALRIPIPEDGARSRFVKYTCSSEEAFAAVTVAINAKLGADGTCLDARIGLGSVAPTPIRATAAEDLLRGQRLSSDVINEAANAAAEATDPSSDGQGSADYRRAVTAVWMRRLLDDIAVGYDNGD